MNFPENSEDGEGFAALQRVLKDRNSSQLVQSSQDILTLLSQDGIYMDDLRPDMARPEVWRRFAAGERGRTIAALGGVRDRGALARATLRLKQDSIFRDSAHHFLRLFDKNFLTFEQTASDVEIAAPGKHKDGPARSCCWVEWPERLIDRANKPPKLAPLS